MLIVEQHGRPQKEKGGYFLPPGKSKLIISSLTI